MIRVGSSILQPSSNSSSHQPSGYHLHCPFYTCPSYPLLTTKSPLPSKDSPYDPNKDSILRRAKGMFSAEDLK